MEMTDTIDNTTPLPLRDSNGKIIPEPIDLDAVKDIPGDDDAYKIRLARMNLILRFYDQGVLPPQDMAVVNDIKTRAESSYAVDPNGHFLEHFLRAYLECSEERRKEQEKYREQERVWREREERQAASSKQAREPNKQVLFDALVSLGVHTVDVEFSGYGDSGQIDEITAKDASKQEIKLPDTPTIVILTVEHESVRVGGCHSTSACEVCKQGGLHQNAYKVDEAIEAVCNGWLEEVHGGWENNEGAYGSFEFNVAERTVTLEFCERYTETNEYTHEF